MIGGFGRAEVFSFHATEFFNSFEGGAITTNDDDLAKKIRLMTNFGFAGYDNVVHVGTNGKMNEMSAAMGLTSLRSVGEFVDVNRRNSRGLSAPASGHCRHAACVFETTSRTTTNMAAEFTPMAAAPR